MIDRFLDVVPEIMSATSCIYLCVLKENQPGLFLFYSYWLLALIDQLELKFLLIFAFE